jgi:hypothetical protein
MSSKDNFSNLFSVHRNVHDNLARAGQPLSEFEMITKITQAVSNFAGYTECIKNYKIAHPALIDQTFTNLGAFVVLQSPNITTGAIGYSAAAVTLEQVAAMIAAESKKSYAQGVQDGSSARVRTTLAPRRDGTINRRVAGGTRSYCFLHGYVNHSGPDCDLMKTDTLTYTPARVNAKDHLSGGSKRFL